VASEAQRAKPKVRRRSQRRRTEGDHPTSRRSEAKGEQNEANMSQTREDSSRRPDSFGEANWMK